MSRSEQSFVIVRNASSYGVPVVKLPSCSSAGVFSVFMPSIAVKSPPDYLYTIIIHLAGCNSRRLDGYSLVNYQRLGCCAILRLDLREHLIPVLLDHSCKERGTPYYSG